MQGDLSRESVLFTPSLIEHYLSSSHFGEFFSPFLPRHYTQLPFLKIQVAGFSTLGKCHLGGLENDSSSPGTIERPSA